MNAPLLATRKCERPPERTNRQKSLRLNANAKAVLDELRSAAQPLKAYSLLERLEERGINAPMSIYRALDQLIDKGFVKKVHSLNAFIALPFPQEVPVAFLICRTCGHTRMEEIRENGQQCLSQIGLELKTLYVESEVSCCGGETCGTRTI